MKKIIIPTLALLTVLEIDVLEADETNPLVKKTLQSLDVESVKLSDKLAGGTCTGDCVNGTGTMVYINGEKYEGEWKNGKQHGKGILTRQDGYKYEGEWLNGERSGQGICIYNYKSGLKYEGEWKNNVRNGKGVLTYPSGYKYEGDWKEDKKNGHGIFVSSTGFISYEGGWKDDKHNGYGINIREDGTKYEGEWKDEYSGHGKITYPDGGQYKGGWEGLLGERKGYGIMTYPDGSQYEGEWGGLFNNRNGHGIMIYPNGNKYEGEWGGTLGKENGQGIMIYANGNKYQGEWKDGDQEGNGIMTYPDGRRYEGTWHINDKAGQGIMTYADGSRYEGEWKLDMKHGQGTMTYVDGSKYKGDWLNGMKYGNGIETYPDGSKYGGQWTDDKKNGEGIATYADGSQYKGQWSNGKKDEQATKDYLKWQKELAASTSNRNKNEVTPPPQKQPENCIGNCINGKGILTDNYGRKYEGQWKNGERNGIGVETNQFGEKYQGRWENGQLNGQGTYTEVKETELAKYITRYTGEFKKGLYDGHGTKIKEEIEKTGEKAVFITKYVGEFKDYDYDGHGTETYERTDIKVKKKYIGNWKNGKKQGYGIETENDGTQYAGEWQDGKYNGKGVLTYKDGSKYDGQWKNGKKDGKGKVTSANGNTYDAEYKEDKEVKLVNANNNSYVGEFDINARIQELEKNPDNTTDQNGKNELWYLQELADSEKGDDYHNAKNTKGVGISLNWLANFYVTQGKYEQAEPLYLRSLAIKNANAELAKKNDEEPILEKFEHTDEAHRAETLNNLATLYLKQGRYESAEVALQKSLTIYETAIRKNYPDVAASLKNAPTYQEILSNKLWKNIKVADTHFILKRMATELEGLANLYAAQGKYAQAEPLLQKSLTISEKIFGQNHIETASALGSLGGIYFNQGQYAQAEPFLQKSSAILEQSVGEDKEIDNKEVAKSLNALAELYRKQGKLDKAEPVYLRGLALLKKALSKDVPETAEILKNLASLYAAQGKTEQAAPLLQTSLRVINQALDHWLWGAGEKTRQAYLQQQEANRNTYLSFYSLANMPEEALYFSLSQKGLLLRISSETNALAKQSSDPAIKKQTQEFNRLKTQLSTLSLSGKANKAEIQTLEDKINTLEMQLSQSVSGFKRSHTEVTPAQVLEKLNATQTLVDFLVYKEFDFKTQKKPSEQIIALIADKENGIKLIKLGELAPIAKAIKSYRQSISRANKDADSLEIRENILSMASQDLYKLIWQPLSAYVENKAEIYLIPDGILHLLPFKALKDKQGHYLAENKQITLLSSARDIVLPPLTGKSNDSAIFAAPVYGDTVDKINTSDTVRTRSIAIRQKDIYFAPLDGAAAEGKALSDLLKAKQTVKFFHDEQVTEASVDAIQSPRFLHFATHGFFLENLPQSKLTSERGLTQESHPKLSQSVENPLTRSGLALTGANSGINGKKQADGTDGILTALEVLALNLEGTDLVTLSACETGVGDIQVGEGVYSLNRAFQEAGAKAVLSTLWSVADEQTKLFMQEFYTLVLNGDSPQQALQKTQLKFINDKNTQDPFFWAAFTVVGL